MVSSSSSTSYDDAHSMTPLNGSEIYASAGGKLDNPISVEEDDFQILYQTSALDRMKSDKEAKEVRLRSLMASVTESEAAVQLMEHGIRNSFSPRKRVSFRQGDEVYREPVNQIDNTPTQNLRKFQIEDADAMSEITDNHTIGSNRSNLRTEIDIPRTPVSMSNVVIVSEQEWIPVEQPVFQIRRSPANEQSKRVPLSKDELERPTVAAMPGDDSTVTIDVESVADYTARLHSGFSLTSSSNSSNLRAASSLSTEGTRSEQVCYTQISTSETSSLWKEMPSVSHGALTTHNEEDGEDIGGVNKPAEFNVDTSSIHNNFQTAVQEASSAPSDPAQRNTSDKASAENLGCFEGVATSVCSGYSNDVASIDAVCLHGNEVYATQESCINPHSDPNLVVEQVDATEQNTPTEVSTVEAKSTLEPGAKSKKRKKSSKKKIHHKVKQSASLENDLSAHSAQSAESRGSPAHMLQHNGSDLDIENSAHLRPFSVHTEMSRDGILLTSMKSIDHARSSATKRSASDGILMSRQHQIAKGRIMPTNRRNTQSEPTMNYHASSTSMAVGIPIIDEEIDGVSALTGDLSTPRTFCERRQGNPVPVATNTLITSLKRFVTPSYANQRHKPSNPRSPSAIEAASNVCIEDLAEYNQWSLDATPRYVTPSSTRKIFWCVACTLVLLGIMLSFAILSSRQRSSSSTLTPSASPFKSMTRDELFQVLISASADNGAALTYGGTPQLRAASWLWETSNDPSVLASESQLLQRYAMAVVFFGLGGEEWKNKDNWMTDDHVCTWFSQSQNPCLGEDLIDLNLRFNGLKGSIPEEIGLLSELRSVDLSENRITSSLPEGLWMLRGSLQTLALKDNLISGVISTHIGELSFLETLDFSINRFTYEIPTEIGRNVNLREMKLSLNGLYGKLPSEIGELSALIELDIRGNTISGEIPMEFFNLTNLASLDLTNNRMIIKNLPTEIGSLSRMTLLNLEGCGVSGLIPSEIGAMNELLSISLKSNDLSGAIPSTLGKVTSLVMLDLSQNRLTGLVPSEIGQLQSLKTLMVNSNVLTGEIPVELSNLTSFQALFDFRENSLNGSIPLQLCEQSCCANGEVLVDTNKVVPCPSLVSCPGCPRKVESVFLKTAQEKLP